MVTLLVSMLLTAEPAACKTVAECWLDEKGGAIARPKSKRGRPLPKPDCGKNLLWLRYQLSCDQGACVSRFVGDAC